MIPLSASAPSAADAADGSVIPGREDDDARCPAADPPVLPWTMDRASRRAWQGSSCLSAKPTFAERRGDPDAWTASRPAFTPAQPYSRQNPGWRDALRRHDLDGRDELASTRGVQW
jgi:hypothetical protein